MAISLEEVVQVVLNLVAENTQLKQVIQQKDKEIEALRVSIQVPKE